ncbi:type II secretion system F family protein [Thiomicrorhabdus sp.]|uniref:type II secretion system F family protein n=1 Tax=Thiomicrorhabdus sp. TaxID=2039724 RepID=UPI002AA8189C|nr:type II secretion system F family protein [Thiomicrorhabdus sp.]
MNMVILLLIVGLLSFFSVWLLVNRVMKLQAKQIEIEHLKSRVGLANKYTAEKQSFSNCWWCSLGKALAPKSKKELAKTQQQLFGAGFRNDKDVGGYFFIKYSTLIMTILGMLALWSWYSVRLEWAVLVVIIMILLPERILIFLGQKRLAQVSTDLPDFLDMCNVCMNAGLSYLVAIKRVSHELKEVHPEICYEFEYVLDQIQIGVARTDALRQFAQRNPTKDIQNLVQVLIQNEKLGSSISAALNSFSRRMYQEREQFLEEKAAKTSAKMAVVIMPFLMMPYLVLLVGERMVMLARGF